MIPKNTPLTFELEVLTCSDQLDTFNAANEKHKLDKWKKKDYSRVNESALKYDGEATHDKHGKVRRENVAPVYEDEDPAVEIARKKYQELKDKENGVTPEPPAKSVTVAPPASKAQL